MEHMIGALMGSLLAIFLFFMWFPGTLGNQIGTVLREMDKARSKEKR
jgi:hypothetical protein